MRIKNRQNPRKIKGFSDFCLMELVTGRLVKKIVRWTVFREWAKRMASREQSVIAVWARQGEDLGPIPERAIKKTGTPCHYWSWWRESDPWPPPYQGGALPLSHTSTNQILDDFWLIFLFVKLCSFCFNWAVSRANLVFNDLELLLLSKLW